MRHETCKHGVVLASDGGPNPLCVGCQRDAADKKAGSLTNAILALMTGTGRLAGTWTNLDTLTRELRHDAGIAQVDKRWSSTGVSAALRTITRAENGGWRVERRPQDGGGSWDYQILPPDGSAPSVAAKRTKDQVIADQAARIAELELQVAERDQMLENLTAPSPQVVPVPSDARETAAAGSL